MIFRFIIADQNNRILRSSNGYFETYAMLPEPFTLSDVREKCSSNSGLFVSRITKKMETSKHNDIIRLTKLSTNSLICKGAEWLGVVCFEK